MSTSPRILVVYYSLTGNTARVATDLAKRLDADVESLRDDQHGMGGLGPLRAAFDAWRKAPAKIGGPRFDPSQYERKLTDFVQHARFNAAHAA